MAKEKSAVICGVTGFGSSVTEAKNNAKENIEKYFLQNRTPHIFKLGWYIGLIWVEFVEGYAFSQWHYRLINLQEDRSSGEIKLSCSSGYPNFEKAERAMRFHAAQNLFEFATDDPENIVLNEDDKVEHARWCNWQRLYRRVALLHPDWDDTDIRQQVMVEEQKAMDTKTGQLVVEGKKDAV